MDKGYGEHRKQLARQYIFMDALINPLAKQKTAIDAVRQLRRLRRIRPMNQTVDGVEYRTTATGRKRPIKPKAKR